MEQCQGILSVAIDNLQTSEIEDVFEGDKHQEASELLKMISLSTSKLRKLIRETPSKEKDVQVVKH